jgi:hypothetical protein
MLPQRRGGGGDERGTEGGSWELGKLGRMRESIINSALQHFVKCGAADNYKPEGYATRCHASTNRMLICQPHVSCYHIQLLVTSILLPARILSMADPKDIQRQHIPMFWLFLPFRCQPEYQAVWGRNIKRQRIPHTHTCKFTCRTN